MWKEDTIIEARWSDDDHTAIIALINEDDGQPDLVTEFIIESGSAEHTALNDAGWSDKRISNLTAEWAESTRQAVLESLQFNAQQEFQAIEEAKEHWKGIAQTKLREHKTKVRELNEESVLAYNAAQEVKDKLEIEKRRMIREITIARKIGMKEDVQAMELVARFLKEYNEDPDLIAGAKSALGVEGEVLTEILSAWVYKHTHYND